MSTWSIIKDRPPSYRPSRRLRMITGARPKCPFPRPQRMAMGRVEWHDMSQLATLKGYRDLGNWSGYLSFSDEKWGRD